MKILIADDDDSVRGLLAIELRSMGHEVREVSDGSEAAETAVRERFEMIFLDVLMPKLNGYDALSRLRAAGYAGRVVVVTALSTHTTSQLEGDARPDALISKPFRRRELVKVLDRLAAP